MFGFVICFVYICILLLVDCVDLLPVQCIHFMTYFRRLCFTTVCLECYNRRYSVQ